MRFRHFKGYKILGMCLGLLLTAGCIFNQNSDSSKEDSSISQGATFLERARQRVEVHNSPEVYNGPEAHNGTEAHTSTELHTSTEVYGGSGESTGDINPFLTQYYSTVCQLIVQCYPNLYASINACLQEAQSEQGNLGSCTFNSQAASECTNAVSQLTCDGLEDGFPAACAEVYTDC